MTGEECSQPPDGVDETMLPALIDDVEMHGVAAHRAEPADGRLAGAEPPTVGSPAPAAVGTVSRRSFTTAPKPSIEPGRNSSEALSPMSLRRSAL